MVLLHMPLQGRNPHEAGLALLETLYGKPLPKLARTPQGKPYFVDSPLHFSISHTKHYVFCALSDTPIGIDAEETDRPINLALAKKILSPAEHAQWKQAEDPRLALLRFWVLKEAAAKCTGTGLRIYPNHTTFSLDDPRIQEIDGCFVAVITHD